MLVAIGEQPRVLFPEADIPKGVDSHWAEALL